ncbi:hypothetical protein CABS01_11902 [Colletotrichum abscissum]|uniref:Uncharacterized protein n=1 Tax=Colletotrichum abscissum TaxID=1671311 RepID=A0A9P9XEA4_9PEZI|nr:uncharacterized protein CABS01_11902 [Colletotrichum abscissum]KAI3548888.1 hypothetical protein CABS02_08091 [Colletotrichum abscissum]KAK1492385.1 hypothetical protein CABS01_11902 [Colletotrichum abscissum]
MSFYEGDSRTGPQPAPPPRALTAGEIGAIIGTVIVFIGVVGALFFYRTHKAKRRRAEHGERVDDDDDDEHRLHDTRHRKGEDGIFQGGGKVVTKPLPARKKTWDPYEGAKTDESDAERGESHEMRTQERVRS